MAKEHLVVNGFRIPGAWGGVAVRRACELITMNPGIPQSEVLKLSVSYSGLSLSQAGWLTSPGPKSPATVLWDRRKEGTFRCYPNERTGKVFGAEAAALKEILSEFESKVRRAPDPGVKVGDLVRFEPTSPYHDYPAESGIVIGYMFADGEIFNSLEDVKTSGDKVRNSLHWAVIPAGQSRPRQAWVHDTRRERPCNLP